jgi:methionine synthase II (cobalamin-independent)
VPNIEFGCRPLLIGSMPHKDPEESCKLVNRYLKDFPVWPQLPFRSFLENMYTQFSEGFPGVMIEGTGDKEPETKSRLFIDQNQNLNISLEKIYDAYLKNRFNDFPIHKDYAAGLYYFLQSVFSTATAVKGQVTGPVSWGLFVTDKENKPIIYDDILADSAAKLLRLKAEWQEQELKKINEHTIIFIDEPYMSSIGSAFVSLSNEKILALLEEVLNGIHGLKGIHCCGNMDWSVLFRTTTDIISFDTYNYAESFTLYKDDILRFINKLGTIAWGIVPCIPDLLIKETVSSLRDRLFEAMAIINRQGIPFRQIIRQSIITPSCGLATLGTNDAAEEALRLLSGLSDNIRQKYNS